MKETCQSLGWTSGPLDSPPLDDQDVCHLPFANIANHSSSAQLTATVKPLFYLEGNTKGSGLGARDWGGGGVNASDRMKKTSQFVCLRIHFGQLEKLDYLSIAQLKNQTSRGLFRGISFHRKHLHKTKPRLQFPSGHQWQCFRGWFAKSRLIGVLEHVRGMWEGTAHISFCLQWRQDVAWKLCNVCLNIIVTYRS